MCPYSHKLTSPRPCRKIRADRPPPAATPQSILLFVAAADDDDDDVDMAAAGVRRRDLPRYDDAMATERRSGLVRIIAVVGRRPASLEGESLQIHLCTYVNKLRNIIMCRNVVL